MKRVQPTKHVKITMSPVIWAYIKKWTAVLNGTIETKSKRRIREDQVIAAILTIAVIDGREQFDRLQAEQLSKRLESIGLLGFVCPEGTESTTDTNGEHTETKGSIP